MPMIRFGKFADLSEAGFKIPESGHKLPDAGRKYPDPGMKFPEEGWRLPGRPRPSRALARTGPIPSQLAPMAAAISGGHRLCGAESPCAS